MIGTGTVWTLLALLGLCLQNGAADLPPEPDPAIVATQVTLQVGPVRGRATVIAVADNSMTVLTAAHFLSDESVGNIILIHQHDCNLSGQVMAVARNPSYHPIRSRNPRVTAVSGTLGVDNEIATIKVELHGESDDRSFQKIKAAELTTQPVPGGGVQIVSVHIIDQLGTEHVVRAGNHLNPKCLAWGRKSYDVQKGDSGAGVFIMRSSKGGGLRPILIGNVAQTDDRGGIASLAHRSDAWIETALVRQQARAR
jgi:hypothetical protein